MKISFSPSRKDETLSIIKSGEKLNVNNREFDFSPLKEGGTLPCAALDSDWFVGNITRVNGEIQLTIVIPHGPNPPNHLAFPNPVHVTQDGPINLPSDEVYL